MSKADKAALNWLPKRKDGRKRYYNCNDDDIRRLYAKGYRKAEKDLGLGWEDVRIILDAENDILRECNSQKELVIETYPKGEDYYGEILKRFKERKEK